MKNIKKIIKKISVKDTITIKKALNIIDQEPLGFLLIVNDKNQFKGVITEGDIRRLILSGRKLSTSLKDFINTNPVIAHSNDNLEKIKNKLSKNIRFIPVLNKENRVIDIFLYSKRVLIPVTSPFLSEEELNGVTDCVLSGWISSAGKYISLFEKKFAEYCGTKYGVATSSGTTALHLALVSLGIGKGEEVIIPNLTFIATANAVTYSGAKVVLADIEKDTFNIDPRKIEPLITKNTKAIIPVHLYGHPVDMDPILKIAKRHNLYVIEDAAEAHGAEYKGKKVGGIGDISIFSFYGNKIITTGEGGMITTNNEKIAERARILRNHGMDTKQKYYHPFLGYNYRLTNLQAAIGIAQLKKIKNIIQRKREIVKLYNQGLKDIPEIILPIEKNWAKNVYWLYSILINEEKSRIDRNSLIDKLQAKKIDARPFFLPINEQPYYFNRIRFPVSKNVSSRGLNLPSSISIENEEIKYVISSIKKVFKKYGK